jgi:hypothetical protein
MSKIEVNTVAPQCGTTLTLGESGDTVQLGTGASQSGFGRTGTVDWQTSIKTSTFTAANGEGYFVNTTGGAVTVNLPAGSVGAIVSIKDYAQTFDTNNCTISADGSEKIEGITNDLILNTEGVATTLVYADATRGWQAVNSNEVTNAVKYVTASGGTESTSGDFKIHTFTGPGTFTVSCAGNAAGNNQLEYTVVAGGGGGGGTQGGGGGAGGFRFASPSLAPLCYPAKPLAGSTLTATATAFPITVGGGGAGAPTGPGPNGTSGNPSVFDSITSTGGGGGASSGSPTSGTGASNPTPAGGYSEGLPGGSGGGTRGTYLSPGASNPNNHYYNPGGVNVISNGNTPPVSPSQGNRGGAGFDSTANNSQAGGGGGATAVGSDARGPGNGTNSGGPGGAGAGLPTAFGSNGVPCGSFRYYAGGGGGGQDSTSPFTGGIGGLGGGGTGNGNPGGGSPGGNGTTNTGGGAGAGAGNPGGTGGSGIVIIRYKFQN